MTDTYDVICIGGASTGSAVAYFLTENPDFGGTVAVIEPDLAPGADRDRFRQTRLVNVEERVGA